ncbi:unnamed protein product [Meganyctiphanes norvegica]|uniref:Uncharacterized protein n=1 Tax=Meganyctiphanes norvegica TaxID=48144 RepID=A0AAV2REI6_MEGNR
MCDVDTHVYEYYCEPPAGAILPPSNDTTILPYPILKPIEKCCPACYECEHLAGHCKLRWITHLYPEWCDFKTPYPCRDYSCTCCVKCAEDKCSDCVQTGGNCRVECRSDEKEDKKNLCKYSDQIQQGGGCKCCKLCEPTPYCLDLYGICHTHPDDCPTGSAATTGCCGGCYCCKPTLQPIPATGGSPGGCYEPGSYCSETDDCSPGYYACFGQCIKTLWHAGLQSTELGYCCVPKATGSGVKPGRSVALPNLKNALMGRLRDQF